MSDDKEVRRGAKALSRRGSSQGGQARAARLTPIARSEIARNAARARWGDTVPIAPWTGDLQVGDRLISCAVTEDGTRIINQGTMLTALGRNRRPKSSTETGVVLFAANLQPFVSDSLRSKLDNPITYALPGGGRALGYPAEVLPEVCDVYLAARAAGPIPKSQWPAANAAEILVRGLARVGITALVDEATGFQEVRARDELQQILEAYVQAEYRKWVKTFPDVFFEEIYRLHGWEFKPGTAKRTPYVGKLVNKYVYEQLPPGVLDELRRLNPRNEHGNRTRTFHQFLTADTGNVHLDRQISTVTTLMRISDTKEQFEELFERAYPPPQQRLALVVAPPPPAEEETA